MGHDADIPGIVDQRIASDAAGGLIGLAEPAVDDDEPAAALDGALALLGLDGDMAVDDMAMGTLQAKLLQDALAHLRVVIKGVVAVFGLGPGALILDEPPLKGGHSVPAEDGAVPARPEPPQEVHAELPLRGTGLVIISLAGGLLGVVQKLPARALFSADGEFQEGAILGHGDAAVKQEIAIEHLVQPALGVEEADVLLQLLAALEGGGELVNDLALLWCQGIGIGWVHSREVTVL